MKRTSKKSKELAIARIKSDVKTGIRVGVAIEAEAKALKLSPTTVTAWYYDAKNSKTGEGGDKHKTPMKYKRKTRPFARAEVDASGKVQLVEPTIKCPLCGHEIDKEEAKKAIRILLDFVSS